jgi:hypothetical protein
MKTTERQSHAAAERQPICRATRLNARSAELQFCALVWFVHAELELHAPLVAALPRWVKEMFAARDNVWT